MNGNAKERGRRVMKVLGRVALYGTVAVICVLMIVHFAWKFSGSDRWELVQDKGGVKVYGLKASGKVLKKFKGTVRVKSSLSTAVKATQDPTVCDYTGACYGSTLIERVDDSLQYYSFRMDYGSPFAVREVVVKEQFSQDPATGQVLAEVIAVPDKIPANNCCIRIETMHNTWRFTPLKDGQIEIQYVINMEDGGYVPYVLSNFANPRFLYYTLSLSQKILDKEKQKYPDVKFSYIHES